MTDAKRGRTRLLIILCVIALAALVIAGIYLIRRQMTQKAYTQTIETAGKYIEIGDYDSAVAAYEEAIDLCPYEEEAYLDLAQLYVDQGEASLAKYTLRLGSASVSSSSDIDNMLEGILNGSITIATLEVTALDEEAVTKTLQVTGNPSVSTSFIQKLENYTYEDYVSAYGTAQITQVDSDTVEVSHGGLDATFTYANTADADDIVVNGAPAEDSQPQTVVFADLSDLFEDFSGTATLSQLQAISSRTLSVSEDAENGRYTVTLTIYGLEICVETDENGTLLSADAWNEVTLTEANADRTSTGTYAGVVIDATSGEGVSGAAVSFTGQSTGYNAQTTTASDGSFSVELEPDTYDMTITKEDYIEETSQVVIESGKNYSGEQYIISPDLASGTMRIVLEWEAEPQDLDAYLSGTTDGGTSFRVCFQDTEATEGGETIAQLDTDDTNGYGPETITIYDLNGTYEYYVADFRVTGTMAQYGATVKVYREGESDPEVIELSSSAGVENVWDVLTIDHGEITIRNASGDDWSSDSSVK